MTQEQRTEPLEAKRRFWSQHIERWKHSGLTQTAYCRQHELKLHRFVYWRKKYHRPEPSPISLVQVQLPPVGAEAMATASHRPLRLVVSSRHCVEVERDFDPVALRQLLHVLERL